VIVAPVQVLGTCPTVPGIDGRRDCIQKLSRIASPQVTCQQWRRQNVKTVRSFPGQFGRKAGLRRSEPGPNESRNCLSK